MRHKSTPHFLWAYDDMFTRLGLRLPFTAFERAIMDTLCFSPTQLHPNGWALIRGYQIVCENLELPLFPRTFLNLYTLINPKGSFIAGTKTRYKNYHSFKGQKDTKIFTRWEESYQDFKWRYFKIFVAEGHTTFWEAKRDEVKDIYCYWNKKNHAEKIEELTADELGQRDFFFLLTSDGPLNLKAMLKDSDVARALIVSKVEADMDRQNLLNSLRKKMASDERKTIQKNLEIGSAAGEKRASPTPSAKSLGREKEVSEQEGVVPEQEKEIPGQERDVVALSDGASESATQPVPLLRKKGKRLREANAPPPPEAFEATEGGFRGGPTDRGYCGETLPLLQHDAQATPGWRVYAGPCREGGADQGPPYSGCGDRGGEHRALGYMPRGRRQS